MELYPPRRNGGSVHLVVHSLATAAVPAVHAAIYPHWPADTSSGRETAVGVSLLTLTGKRCRPSCLLRNQKPQNATIYCLHPGSHYIPVDSASSCPSPPRSPLAATGRGAVVPQTRIQPAIHVYAPMCSASNPLYAQICRGLQHVEDLGL